MSVLTAAPFSLTANTLILVKVRATNIKGDADSYSDINTVGAIVMTSPINSPTPTLTSSTQSSL